MTKRLKKIRDKLTECTGTASCCEIRGFGEILITGCTSLADFNDNTVVVETVNGKIRLCGEDLKICAFRADLLSVTGIISRVEFEGECEW